MTNAAQEKLNIVFMGHFNYPQGMANTKRIQHLIDYLKLKRDVEAGVLVLRQERTRLSNAPPNGVHKGTPYRTIGEEMKPAISSIFHMPKYYREGKAFLKERFRPDCANFCYVYNYPSIDNLPMVRYGRKLGYTFVFDIVEDIRFQKPASDLPARIKHWSAKRGARMLSQVADGVVVISSHLERQIKQLTHGKVPIRMHPISVDFTAFPATEQKRNSPPRIFYGGTFGDKDDVPNLIVAFERLRGKGVDARLVLSGKGNERNMKPVLAQIEASAYRSDIEYMGYLSDEQYYRTIWESDILCMVRKSSDLAQGGFPFKLGEYLATARPVVASDVSDVGQYLRDRENACVVEPESAESLAAALDFLLADWDVAVRIGAAGRETAKKHFDAAMLGRRLREFLEQLQAGDRK